MTAHVFHNPKRILSATAQTDAASIHARPCFLCQNNRPKEQDFITYKVIRYCSTLILFFNPHLTIADSRHLPQSIAERFEDMIDLADIMREYFIMYNGPECGASAPRSCSFQATDKNEFLDGAQGWLDWSEKKVYKQ